MIFTVIYTEQNYEDDDSYVNGHEIDNDDNANFSVLFMWFGL